MTKTKSPEPLPAARLGVMHPSIVPTTRIPLSTRKPRRPLSPTEVRQRAADREEMQSLLAKLKELVPGIPKKRKLSKLEIIQHVIDYIFDLQVQLETHPIAGMDFAALNWATEFAGMQDSAAAAPAAMHYAQYAQNPSTPTIPTTTCPPTQSCDPSSAQYYSQRIPSSRQERQPLASIML